jgi:hypothetical protein
MRERYNVIKGSFPLPKILPSKKGIQQEYTLLESKE